MGQASPTLMGLTLIKRRWEGLLRVHLATRRMVMVSPFHLATLGEILENWATGRPERRIAETKWCVADLFGEAQAKFSPSSLKSIQIPTFHLSGLDR